MIRSLLLGVALVGSTAALVAQDATPTPTPEKPPLVQAAEIEAVKALAGRPVTVEGKVTRVGATSSGGITFINFAGGANGFVAVVFKDDYPAFPDGFEKYKGQTLRVTGSVVIYKETTPQIVVKAPSQIEIMPAPSPTPTPASTPVAKP